jgi:RNA polymerase sigma-70 factor (ECF subfamily)
LGYLRASGCRDAEDVLGDVFVRVAGALPGFLGDDGALRSWVFTIAYRCLVDEHRRARRRRLLAGRLPPAAVSPPPGEPFDAALVVALNALTADQHEVMTLRFVADLSIDDVSDITGRTPGAVKSLQHRGLLALRVLLDAD